MVPLIRNTLTERENALSQWNDSWLITTLKQIYFKKYYEIKKNSKKEYKIISYRLSELLRNEKYYYSLIKRSEDFRILDNVILKEICKNKTRITNIQKELEKKPTKSNSEKIILEIQHFQNNINEILNFNVKKNGFLLAKISNLFEYLNDNTLQIEIKNTIEKIVKDFLRDEYLDVIIEFKRIHLGLKKAIYLFNADGKYTSLTEVSGIADILRQDSNYLPLFYVYILLEKSKNGIKLKDKKFLLKNIGKSIGEIIINKLVDRLKKYNMEI